MITKDLVTLNIHKLSQEQYDASLSAGTLGEDDIYLTPAEEVKIDLNNIPTPTTDTAAANKKYVDDKVAAKTIAVDSALSTTSTNPVQNKVVKAAIDAIPTGPTITYGTTDLVAGSSTLAEGTFYFVYE